MNFSFYKDLNKKRLKEILVILGMGGIISSSSLNGNAIFPWEIPELNQKKPELIIPVRPAIRTNTLTQKTDNESQRSSLLDDEDFLEFYFGFTDDESKRSDGEAIVFSTPIVENPPEVISTQDKNPSQITSLFFDADFFEYFSNCYVIKVASSAVDSKNVVVNNPPASEVAIHPAEAKIEEISESENCVVKVDESTFEDILTVEAAPKDSEFGENDFALFFNAENVEPLKGISVVSEVVSESLPLEIGNLEAFERTEIDDKRLINGDDKVAVGAKQNYRELSEEEVSNTESLLVENNLNEVVQFAEPSEVVNFLLTQNLEDASSSSEVAHLPNDEIQVPALELEQKSVKASAEVDYSGLFCSEEKDKTEASSFKDEDCVSLFSLTSEEENDLKFNYTLESDEEVTTFFEKENSDQELSKKKINLEDLEPEILETVISNYPKSGPLKNGNDLEFIYSLSEENDRADSYSEIVFGQISDPEEALFVDIVNNEAWNPPSNLSPELLLHEEAKSITPLNITKPTENPEKLSVESEKTEKDVESSVGLLNEDVLIENSLENLFYEEDNVAINPDDLDDLFGSFNEDDLPLLEKLFSEAPKKVEPKPAVLGELGPDLWETHVEKPTLVSESIDK
jgi:hypothetical protein